MYFKTFNKLVILNVQRTFRKLGSKGCFLMTAENFFYHRDKLKMAILWNVWEKYMHAEVGKNIRTLLLILCMYFFQSFHTCIFFLIYVCFVCMFNSRGACASWGIAAVVPQTESIAVSVWVFPSLFGFAK